MTDEKLLSKSMSSLNVKVNFKIKCHCQMSTNNFSIDTKKILIILLTIASDYPYILPFA